MKILKYEYQKKYFFSTSRLKALPFYIHYDWWFYKYRIVIGQSNNLVELSCVLTTVRTTVFFLLLSFCHLVIFQSLVFVLLPIGWYFNIFLFFVKGSFLLPSVMGELPEVLLIYLCHIFWANSCNIWWCYQWKIYNLFFIYLNFKDFYAIDIFQPIW